MQSKSQQPKSQAFKAHNSSRFLLVDFHINCLMAGA